ncbi:MAG: hypothetical protein KKD56_08350, partial [Acidobacteria bacterium]|nr:hypothetical protein [Acidobacteriota bacterium]
RIQKSLPDDTVAIPKPPAIPSKPETSNWLTTVLPIGGILLSVILMIVFMGGGSSSMSYLIFIPIMLVSSLAGIITGRVQKKEYARKLAEAHKKFKNNLVEVENRLNAFREKELKLRIEKDPDPGECMRRVQSRDPRLGERRPFDPDFLCPRLGIGDVPSSYHLQVPDIEEYAEEFKDEINRVDQIRTTYLKIPKAPLLARLPITGSIGLAGERNDVLDVTRSFLVHILTHHWVSEVSIAIICKPEYSPEWDWVQSLPNIFAPLKSAKKDVSSTEDAGARLSKFMAALETELQRREQIVETSKVVHRGTDSSTPSVPLPRLVIVLDYLDPTFSHPALMLLLKKGRELGIYGIFLTHKPEQIPGECGAIQVIRGNRLVYEESGTEGHKLECYPDRINLDQVKVFAKTLSSIEWCESKDTTLPPDKITFLELFGVSRVEELPLETWWDNRSPYGFFRAPIGKISDTQPMIFDLNDRDGAHGPHGLLGGMTGSGKSEVLKAIILALAVTHHPYDVNFALIDFKGGAAFNELALLPHTVGVVTDIESNATYAERVILSLAGEIERRKRVIEGARAAFRFGKSHIDEYHGLNVKKPLPRLVIVFDEFAEFKSRYKEESKKLISIARVGRSLGVHLILATQNIEAAIDPEILQNSTFRICLKVSTPEDSVQMVGIPDAVNLMRGRAYFSANTRVLYQSAYSGATYLSGDDEAFPNVFIRVWADGRRENVEVARWSKNKQQPFIPPATEASAVVEHIIATAR